MNIRNKQELSALAAARLERADQEKKIVLWFTCISLGLSLVSTVISALLSHQISQTGGLSGLGTRSLLSSLDGMLPIIQFLVIMGLSLGYANAMLRISRGQYASPNALRMGLDRFWVILRSTVLQWLIYMGLSIVSVYGAITIFLITPLSDSAKELLLPLLQESSILSSEVPLLDEALYGQFADAMSPVLIISGILFVLLAAPIFYRFRLTTYIIIDKPGLGAMAALRESRRIMKGNRFSLFLLDLKLCPYYLALAAATVLGYCDMLLPLLGVELPFSQDVAFYGSYLLYAAATFVICYCMRNRVEVIYALAYDALRPEDPVPQSQVVLGNIFRM